MSRTITEIRPFARVLLEHADYVVSLLLGKLRECFDYSLIQIGLNISPCSLPSVFAIGRMGHLIQDRAYCICESIAKVSCPDTQSVNPLTQLSLIAARIGACLNSI